MNLMLTDLDLGFSNKLYDIELKNLPDKGIFFINDQISCKISSKKSKNGYKVNGELIAKTQFECVRCLDKIPCDHILPISITLINDKYIKSITEKNDLITFSEKQEHIKLGDFFIDIIALEKPMQPLCSIDCKGLCLICGSNRNHNFCSCTTPKQNNAWNELKKLNTK